MAISWGPPAYYRPFETGLGPPRSRQSAGNSTGYGFVRSTAGIDLYSRSIPHAFSTWSASAGRLQRPSFTYVLSHCGETRNADG